MLSKKNTKLHLKRMEPNKQHFTIKKFSVGVASVLVSCTFATYGTATARADESVSPDETVEVVEDSGVSADSNVVTLSGENTSSAPQTSESNENSIENQASEAATSQAPVNSVESTNDANTNTNVAESTTASATSTPQVAQAPASEVATTAATSETSNTPTTVADADNETTVSSWSELVSAMANSKYNIINVTGTLMATTNNNIGSNGHTVTVKGINGARINFATNSLAVAGGSWNITFEDLKVLTGRYWGDRS